MQVFLMNFFLGLDIAQILTFIISVISDALSRISEEKKKKGSHSQTLKQIGSHM